MAEKCRNAYRKRGKNAVFCKAIEGEHNYCGHAYLCPVSGRWEANKCVQCTLRNQKPVV